MTTMTRHLGWRQRTSIVALGAAVGLAAAFGPGPQAATRLGVSEIAGYATVSAADTITSQAVLAEVAAAGVSRRLKSV